MPSKFDIFKGFRAANEVLPILEKSNAPYEEERKSQRELQTYRQKKGIDAQYEIQNQNALMKAMQEQSNIPGGMKLKQYTAGGATYYNPAYSEEMTDQRVQAAIDKKTAMGAGAESGKMALAKESIRNIQDIKTLLFPDGTPESFKRGIAAESNIFGGFSQQAQDVFRKSGASLAARQLISTGVAARPEETEALRKQFIANYKSNPHAAFRALDELQAFYDNYLGTADPSGMFHQQGSELTQNGSSGQPPQAGGEDMQSKIARLKARYYGK